MRGKIVSWLLSLAFLMGFAMNSVAAEYDHETTGWVGIGFNPKDAMEGADYILGYVKDGKVKLRDDYGDTKRNHKEDEKLGGTSDITVVGGEEKGKNTTVEFSIPLNSGDKYDTVLNPEENTVVLLAFGGSRDSMRSKHKYRATLNVNLSSGDVEKVK